MKKPSVIIRPATREDIESFATIPQWPTSKSWVAERDGEIIAMAGFALMKGRWIAFCDLSDDARKYKMTIMRTAKMIMSEAQAMGIRYLYAEASPDESGAVRWLKSLGFRIDPRSAYLYRWEA